MNPIQAELHRHVEVYLENNRVEIPATITFNNDKPDTECTQYSTKATDYSVSK